MALHEPLPCPNCGAEKIDRHRDEHEKFFVQCSSCGLSGTHEDCGISAITTWNALPRMSTIVVWQFQAAGGALENQRLKTILQGILDNDGGEKGYNGFELIKFRKQARQILEYRS